MHWYVFIFPSLQIELVLFMLLRLPQFCSLAFVFTNKHICVASERSATGLYSGEPFAVSFTSGSYTNDTNVMTEIYYRTHKFLKNVQVWHTWRQNTACITGACFPDFSGQYTYWLNPGVAYLLYCMWTNHPHTLHKTFYKWAGDNTVHTLEGWSWRCSGWIKGAGNWPRLFWWC